MNTSLKVLQAMLLIVLLAAPSLGNDAARASDMLAGGIVLVAGDQIDLQWDPAQYPQPGQTFVRWELLRGPAPGDLSLVTSGLEQVTDFYRDSGLAAGVTQYYQLDVIRCVAPCAGPSDERRYTLFSDSATPGLFQGTVVRSLDLEAGVYEIGFAGLDSSAAVYVEQDAILTISTGTTIRVASGISSSSILVNHGTLQVNGAGFENVGLSFGDYYDENSAGEGWVSSASLQDANISLNAQSDVLIQGNTGNFSIYLNQVSHALILDNHLQGEIQLAASASATIRRNRIADGEIEVSGYGAAEGAKAYALIASNTITSTYQHQGVAVSYGAQATVTDNYIQWTGYHGSESSVLVSASDEGTSLTAQRNTIVNGKIAAFWNANIEISDNVLSGGGAAITIGCVVCGTNVQATGSIERNTLEYGWGFEMWGGSQGLFIQHNCIRGNDPGLTVDDYSLVGPVDMRYNWWNSASGPRHPANPGGSGDAIVGNQVLFDPWDQSDAYCLTTPPPPPAVEPAALRLTPTPDSVPPDGHAPADVWVDVLDDEGQPLEGVEVAFSILPNDAGLQIGALLPKTCTSDSNGRCKVGYVAPWPDEVYRGGVGEGSVTIEAQAGGLVAETDIVFIYLRVSEVAPANVTRNVDWTNVSPYVVFDRQIQPSTITPQTFQVISSIYYRSGFTCNYSIGKDNAFCYLDLSDPLAHPNADKGLIVTAELKGGPAGVLGQDGTFLQRDFSWRYYTTPRLTPQIIPVQVSEGTDLVASRAAVVRVNAGLSEDTELDWVEADVSLTYDSADNYQVAAFRFYPDETGSGPALLTGNSANFYSRDGQVPILGENSQGSHQISVEVTPAQQGYPPAGVPRQWSGTKTVQVRTVNFDFRTFTILGYPIAPSHLFVGDSYPWTAGAQITDLKQRPAVQSGAGVLKKLFPLQKNPLYQMGDVVVSVMAPHIGMSDPAYLPQLLRRNGYLLNARVDLVIFFVPGDWLDGQNHNDPLYHQVIQHVCLVAEDASAAAIAHCIGHLYDLTELQSWTLKGYDLDRDRYVDSQYPQLGYTLPLMHTTAGSYSESQIAAMWVDAGNYSQIVEQCTVPGQQLANQAPAQALDTVPLALGGEIQVQAGATSGLLDIVEMPASDQVLPAPDGSGDYTLRLKDAGGTLLATHAFTPRFETLSDGRAYASFLFALDVPAETHQVELLWGETLLHAVTASQNAPQVAISQPDGGSYSGTLQVAWTASDADGATDLRSRAFYSTDDGTTWMPLSLDTGLTSLEVDTRQFASCQQCRIQVVVSDGFQRAQAISSPFSVANPPQVSWLWPAAGSSNAARYAEVLAGFRDDMDPASILASSFTLTDATGASIPGTVTYDPDSRTATLVPEAPLQYGKSYTARLAASVKDISGTSLEADFTWSFQVEYGPFPVYLPSITKP